MPLLQPLSRLLRPRRYRFAAAGAALASVLAAAGCGQLAQKERELTFRIEPGNASWYSGIPEGLVEKYIPVGNGEERLHTWWWPAEREHAPTLLYLHGARWNLTGHLPRIALLRDLGFSVLAIDYRGFGRSGGELPSERTVYEDARIAWAYLVGLQPDPARRFVYGHSLGGAVAIELATALDAQDAGGVIVESTFTSLADVARSLSYPWLPLQLVMSQRFDSVSKISRVDLPLLVVHGSEDRVVSPHFGAKLYEAAGGSKRLLMVEGAGHNNGMRLAQREFREALGELFPIPAL
ncbi:MAG TPA: alpha/beta fold hydrolase [Noviherbaspirillum sp.]|nr:alpha/beta fold hydrolase [Noviherbaspirillum sp.]